MARHEGSRPSADAFAKAALSSLLLAGVGALTGMLLGQFVVGERFSASIPGRASYAELSSNPDAVGPDVLPSSLCEGCTDGYIPPTRAFAAQELDAYDPPEAVLIDYSSAPADDDYRYGGSFDDYRSAGSFEDAEPALPAEPSETGGGGSKLLVLSDERVPDAPRPAAIPIPAAN